MNKGDDRLSSPSSRTLRKALLASLVLILAIVFLASPLFAGSWPMERRATYISIGYQGFSGQEYFGPTGETLGLQRLEEQTLSFYSEYGYSRYVSAIVRIPAFRKLYAQEGADSPLLTVQSPGDVDLGLRFTLWPGENDAVSLTGLFGIPLGETNQVDRLWAGDNEYNQLVQLRYGHTFESIPAHVHVEGGYNFRNAGFADQIHLGAEVAIRPIDMIGVNFRVLSVRSQGNGDPAFTGGSFGFASNNQQYLLYGPEVELWLSQGMGFNVGLFRLTNAQNMPTSTMLQTGVFFLLTPPGR